LIRRHFLLRRGATAPAFTVPPEKTTRKLLERERDGFVFIEREEWKKPPYLFIYYYNRFGSLVNRSRLQPNRFSLIQAHFPLFCVILLCWLHPLHACCTPLFLWKIIFSYMLILTTFMHFVQINFAHYICSII